MEGETITILNVIKGFFERSIVDLTCKDVVLKSIFCSHDGAYTLREEEYTVILSCVLIKINFRKLLTGLLPGYIEAFLHFIFIPSDIRREICIIKRDNIKAMSLGKLLAIV